MQLYKTLIGNLLVHNQVTYLINKPWDILINRDNLHAYLLSQINSAEKTKPEKPVDLLTDAIILPPVGLQEIWAAGVTYLRSRDARVEESEKSGASDLYDKVYDAERPELFFKATAARVAGHGQPVYIRKDSAWNVPEPELTLYINSNGNIQGYTCGNDMSSRSIEGENALYLPQAKIYEKSAALGPSLYVIAQPVSGDTAISIKIKRNGATVYEDATTTSRIKRSFTGLVSYLFAECDFPNGVFLMTGTGLVPSGDFTLQPGDVVEITITGVGTLINTVTYNSKHG